MKKPCFSYSCSCTSSTVVVIFFKEKKSYEVTLFKMENFNQVQKRKIEDSSEDDKESKKMHKDSLSSKSQIAAESTLIDEDEDSARAKEIMESLDLSDSSLVDDKTFDDHINTIVSIVNSVPDEEVSSPQDCIDKLKKDLDMKNEQIKSILLENEVLSKKIAEL